MSDKGDWLSIVNDLDKEIALANGIEAAIAGLRDECGDTTQHLVSGVKWLQAEHIDRLGDIRQRIERLTGINTPEALAAARARSA